MKNFKRAIDLFDEYSIYFGVLGKEYLARQCEFEDKFNELVCDVKGHDIGPDQCGIPEHDYCYRCDKLRVDLVSEDNADENSP